MTTTESLKEQLAEERERREQAEETVEVEREMARILREKLGFQVKRAEDAVDRYAEALRLGKELVDASSRVLANHTPNAHMVLRDAARAFREFEVQEA